MGDATVDRNPQLGCLELKNLVVVMVIAWTLTPECTAVVIVLLAFSALDVSLRNQSCNVDKAEESLLSKVLLCQQTFSPFPAHLVLSGPTSSTNAEPDTEFWSPTQYALLSA